MELIHHHFDTLSSTNDWGKHKLKTFARDKLTLITALEQTKGRGQYGRKWISPKSKNLYASFCFFIDDSQQDPLSLTHVMALTISDILKTHGLTCQIKWPNDLIINKKKIAGILCETEHLPPHFGVILGVGLNINMSAKELLQIGQPATSLTEETQLEWEPGSLLKEISHLFAKQLTLFLHSGFTPFLPQFRKLAISNSANEHIL